MTQTHNSNTNDTYTPAPIVPKVPDALVQMLAPRETFPFAFPKMVMASYAGRITGERSYTPGITWNDKALSAMTFAMDDELEIQSGCENQQLVLDWRCLPLDVEHIGYQTYIALLRDGSDYVDDDDPLSCLGMAFLRFDVLDIHTAKLGFYSYHIPPEKEQPHLVEWYDQGPYTNKHIHDIHIYLRRVLNEERAWKPLYQYMDS